MYLSINFEGVDHVRRYWQEPVAQIAAPQVLAASHHRSKVVYAELNQQRQTTWTADSGGCGLRCPCYFGFDPQASDVPKAVTATAKANSDKGSCGIEELNGEIALLGAGL